MSKTTTIIIDNFRRDILPKYYSYGHNDTYSVEIYIDSIDDKVTLTHSFDMEDLNSIKYPQEYYKNIAIQELKKKISEMIINIIQFE